MFLSCGDGYLRDIQELLKGCPVLFRVSGGNAGFLWRHCSGKEPHLALRGRISWFVLNCGRTLEVPLKLRRGPQGPARLASENSILFLSLKEHDGFSLKSLPANRAVARVQSGNSVFLSTGSRDLRLPHKVQLGTQASSGGEAQSFAFLLSCQMGVRPPVALRQGILAFSRGSAGASGLPSCCEGIHGVPLEPRLSGYLSSRGRDIGPHLGLRPENQISSPVMTWISGFLWSLNRGVRPISWGDLELCFPLDVSKGCQAS